MNLSYKMLVEKSTNFRSNYLYSPSTATQLIHQMLKPPKINLTTYLVTYLVTTQ